MVWLFLIALPPYADAHGILDGLAGYQDQVASAARAGDLPAEGLVAVGVDLGQDVVCQHVGEHGHLRFEALAHPAPKRDRVPGQGGAPADLGGVGQRFCAFGSNVGILKHVEPGRARVEWDQVQGIFYKV